MKWVVLTVALVGFALWAMIHGRREKSGPANNWENEDYLSREADGTWAEGSTHSTSEPTGSFYAHKHLP